MIRGLLSFILLGVLAATAAFAQGPAKDNKDEKLPPPSFKPGAEVDLVIDFNAPVDWKLNYQVPITVTFDEEWLKKAPVAVSKDTWEHEFEHYSMRETMTIPVTLRDKLDDGNLSIPMTVFAMICTVDDSSCTVSEETFNVTVTVKSKASQEEKNQALDKGQCTKQYRLSAPY